jgi:hypothetical protein
MATEARELFRHARGLPLALMLSALPLAASSAPRIELQAGPSYMDCHAASAVFLEAMGRTEIIGTTHATWQPVISLGVISPRNVAHYDKGSYNTGHGTEVIAGGARFRMSGEDAWYGPLFLGFELAYNQHLTKSLSSHYEFMSTLGWQGKRFSFQLRHLSNGGFHEPNRGETMALLGIRLNP